LTVKPSRLTVSYWLVDRLLPYARNARTHPDEQVQQLADSIKAFGFNVPCLVDASGVLVAGHGRLLAAQKLGLPEVPVVQLGHLSEAEARAYRLADNRIALNSEWDEALLAEELKAVMAEGEFGLEDLGFAEDELEALLEPEMESGPKEGEDDAPEAEPEAAAVARAGDVWLLGEHRVGCGDSTDKAAVGRLLAGAKPNLMVTDPPYGVEYDADWRNRAMRADGSKVGGRAVGKVLNDERADWTEAWELFPGAVAYVWHGGLHAGTVADSLGRAKFKIRSQIIWVKTRFALSRGHYHWQHEPALYGVRDGQDDGWRFVEEHEVAAYAVKEAQTGAWRGGRKQSTVWVIEHIKSETGHSTQKPVECMRRPIVNNSKRGDAVYDPFLGSGTTVIAAETEGRRAFGMELNPAYVDVIVKRWQTFTGKQARLEGDGRSFEEIAAARAAELGKAA
jgi:DNA modification methylase